LHELRCFREEREKKRKRKRQTDSASERAGAKKLAEAQKPGGSNPRESSEPADQHATSHIRYDTESMAAV
jgi:hypothetical protein